VLARLVAGVRDRAARRLHTRLLAAAPGELRARLEKLLIVHGGSRRSELDRLRRPPFSPTITGLVNALERLADVRALGADDLDLSALPAPRVAALARYADQAWATQLADLGTERRVATLPVAWRPCHRQAGPVPHRGDVPGRERPDHRSRLRVRRSSNDARDRSPGLLRSIGF